MTSKQNKFALALAAPVLAVVLAGGIAYATGSTSGELVPSGGSVKGDISKTAGEEDRVFIDLVAGEKLDLRVQSGFQTVLELRDPQGDAIDVGAAPGRNVSGAVVPVPSTGRYEIVVRSADDGQGFYKLVAKAGWEKKLQVTDTGDTEVEVWMPAGGRLKAKFRGAGDVGIVELLDPMGAQVLGPVPGKRGRVKLKNFTAAMGGRYLLRLSSSDTIAGTIVRKVKKTRGSKLKLANGLTPVSYEEDGVGTLFKQRCAQCHSWATSFGGVSAYAKQSYSRMRSGNMPPGSGRVGPADLGLVDVWLRTGKSR